MCLRGGKKWWVIFALFLVALLSGGVILPAYWAPPFPELSRSLPAILDPQPLWLRFFYPWLMDTDRRLIVFAWLTVFCKQLAQFLFPALLASSVARALQETSAVPGKDLNPSAILSGRLNSIWRPWFIVSICLLLLGGAINLVIIKLGIMPSFPGFGIPLGLRHDIVAVLSALVGLPLSGLAVGVLSASVGMGLKRPILAAIGAYGVVLIVDSFIGMTALDLPAAIHDFLPPPGLPKWSVAAILIDGLIYGLLNGAVSGVVWYFATKQRYRTKEKEVH